MAVRHDGSLEIRVPESDPVWQWSDGSSTCGFWFNSGTPEGDITANVGSLAMDITNRNLYYKDTGVGNTGWALVDTNTDTHFLNTPLNSTGSITHTLSNNFFSIKGNTGQFDGANFNINQDLIHIQGGTDGSNSGSVTVHDTGIDLGFGGTGDLMLDGSPGTDGQFIKSRGDGLAPIWDTPRSRKYDADILGNIITAAAFNFDLNDYDNKSVTVTGNVNTGILLSATRTGYYSIRFNAAGGPYNLVWITSFVGDSPPTSIDTETFVVHLWYDAVDSAWYYFDFSSGAGTDTNITTGTVAAATGTRNIDLGGNDLNFNSVGAYNITAAGQTYLETSYLGVSNNGTSGVFRLYDADDNAYVAITPRTAVTTYTITLPAAAPSANDQVLSFQTNGLADFVDPPNITTGTLATATGNRDVDFGGNYLNLDNMSDLYIDMTGGTSHTGAFALFGPGAANSYFQFYDSDNSQSCAITTATSMTDWTWTLPAAGPASNDQVMSFTSAGVASFVDPPNITTGTLATATGPRTVEMGGQTLTFNNASGFLIAMQAEQDVDIQARFLTLKGSEVGERSEFWMYDAGQTNSFRMKTPNTLSQSWAIQWPSGPPSSDGQILQFTNAFTSVASFVDPPNITTGTLANATGARAVPMNNQNLTFNSMADLTMVGTTGSTFTFQADDFIIDSPVSATPGRVTFQDGDNSHNVALGANATTTTSYTLDLPPAPPASNGQALTFTTAGVGSFTTISGEHLFTGPLMNSFGNISHDAGTFDWGITNIGTLDFQAVDFGVSVDQGSAFSIDSQGTVTFGKYAAGAQDGTPNRALGIDATGQVVSFEHTPSTLVLGRILLEAGLPANTSLNLVTGVDGLAVAHTVVPNGIGTPTLAGHPTQAALAADPNMQIYWEGSRVDKTGYGALNVSRLSDTTVSFSIDLPEDSIIEFEFKT